MVWYLIPNRGMIPDTWSWYDTWYLIMVWYLISDHGMIPLRHLQSVLVCLPFHWLSLSFRYTPHDSGYTYICNTYFVYLICNFRVSCGQLALVWFSHHMLIWSKVSSAVTLKRSPVVKVLKSVTFRNAACNTDGVSSFYSPSSFCCTCDFHQPALRAAGNGDYKIYILKDRIPALGKRLIISIYLEQPLQCQPTWKWLDCFSATFAMTFALLARISCVLLPYHSNHIHWKCFHNL